MEYGTYDFSVPGLDYSLLNNNDLLFFNNVKFPSESSGNFNSLLGTPTLLPDVLRNSPMSTQSNAVLCFSEEYNAPNSTPHSGCTSGTSASASASVSKQEISFASKKKKKTQKGSQNTKKLSVDPQSVAARHRRHRISKKFKILQTLVPGGTKMDTASMLDEAIQYVKFLKTQIWIHETMGLGYPMNANLANGEGFQNFTSISSYCSAPQLVQRNAIDYNGVPNGM